MNHKEIIDQQISLLAQLNQRLAGQATPEAAREIRENTLVMAKLMEMNEQLFAAELNDRLSIIEEVLFKGEEPNWDILITQSGYRHSLLQFTEDCREDVNSIYEWMEKLENHLDLDEDWQDTEEAGE